MRDTVQEQGDLQPQLGNPATPVVITGGASGIGYATGRALAAVGRSVALWDIDAQGVATAASEIQEQWGVTALGLTCDLRDPQAIGEAAARTREALGAVGGIVHSAGTADPTGIEGMSPEAWEAGLNLHARPVVLLVQAFMDDLAANPGSAVVALSSINATLGSGLIPVYSAGKGAVISLVHSMADALADRGVRINAVSPGQIDTPILQAAKSNLPEGHFERRVQLGRLGTPEEVARMIRFLLSEEASYVTGVEMVVDGGNIHSQRQ